MNQQIKLDQIVPSELCFKCDVCCRFPEKDSFLAPYFTHDEILSASGSGKKSNSVYKFDNQGGCKITLAPFEEGFICPEFIPDSGHCEIYDVRPLDCIIYPFAIMWSAEGKKIVLGLDMKCPYVSEFINSDFMREAVVKIKDSIDSSPVLDIIYGNPHLIGPYQDDVTIVAMLTNLTIAFAGSPPCTMEQN